MALTLQLYAVFCCFMQSKTKFVNAGAQDFPEERRALLREILLRDGRLTVQTVVRDFAVSEDTIRRDLKELESAGLCSCVYGGALLVQEQRFASQQDVGQRRIQAQGRKEKLGEALGKLIEPGQVVFLDAGTTNLAAALFVPDRADVTVITHDPAIAAALIPFHHIRLISIGGIVNREVGAALDAGAMRSIKNLRPDLLFLGSCALDTQKGLTAFSFEDAEVKSALIENAQTVVTGVLNEKLGTVAPYGICQLHALKTLVLEADAGDLDLQGGGSIWLKIIRADAARHSNS